MQFSVQDFKEAAFPVRIKLKSLTEALKKAVKKFH
jgi:hypothetical protein